MWLWRELQTPRSLGCLGCRGHKPSDTPKDEQDACQVENIVPDGWITAGDGGKEKWFYRSGLVGVVVRDVSYP